MIKHGDAPYLECSSKGDKRFSAFFARVRCMDNKTIEEIFQASKKFEDGSYGLSVKKAKGKLPVNIEECREIYSLLWDVYIDENIELREVIKNASGLSDIFGQKGHACQATELWRIRNELILEEGKVKIIEV